MDSTLTFLAADHAAVVANQEMQEAEIRVLADFELLCVGGGSGDVVLG